MGKVIHKEGILCLSCNIIVVLFWWGRLICLCVLMSIFSVFIENFLTRLGFCMMIMYILIRKCFSSKCGTFKVKKLLKNTLKGCANFLFSS